MRTFSITTPQELFRAWDWLRGRLHNKVSFHLTYEEVSDPISQDRRATLWACLEALAAQTVLKSGVRLTSRMWHQVACQRALGFDHVDIGEVSHMVALEPKRLSGEDFQAVADEVILLCRVYGIDLRKVNNANDSKLDGPS